MVVRIVDGQHVFSMYILFLLYFRLMVGRAVDGQRVFSLHVFFYIFDRWCGLWPVLSCCCLLLFGSWVDVWSFGSVFV